MIEPTDEMCAAFFAADRAHRRSELERLGFHGAHLPTMDAGAFRAGLAAVLAIVERDYLTPYFCPTSGEVESPCHGGFDVCCDRPDLHRRPPEATP